MEIPQKLPSKEPNISSILDLEGQKTVDTLETKVEIVDYSQRGQWLRAAVLGENDGLLTTASLMTGIGAIRKDSKIMIVIGVAGMVARACSMAIEELVSVYSQYDIEMAQIRRESKGREVSESEIEDKTRKLANPLKAAAASGMAQEPQLLKNQQGNTE